MFWAKIALAFLDIKKAYDRVDRSLLWSILEGLGYGGKFTRIMQGLYRDLQAKATLGFIESGSIALNVGLKQGCVLSPLLFALYIKEVGDKVTESGKGVKIGVERIPGMFFADDIVLMADSGRDLQHLLDIVAQEVTKKRLQFNPEKSKVLVSWRDPCRTHGWNLGFENDTYHNSKPIRIREVRTYTYLGVWICVRGRTFSTHWGKMQAKGKRIGGILRNISRGGLNNSKCALEGWEKVGIPSLMYASEILPWPVTMGRALDREQNRMGRFLLGTSKGACIEGIRGLLGWWGMEQRANYMFLVYAKRFAFTDDCWGKIVWDGMEVENEQSGVWRKRVRDLCDKYDIETRRP